jgi:drug/metabolite transporter (DMT)-like permease
MTPVGMALIVSCIIVVSINRALVRRATGSFGSFEIVYLTTVMGAVGFSAVSFGGHVIGGNEPLAFFEPLRHTPFVISVLYLGIFAACAAFLLMTYASANLPYAVYSSTCTFSTVVGILAGVLLLKEAFPIQEIIGTAVILAGVIGVSFAYDKDDVQGNRYSAAQAQK